MATLNTYPDNISVEEAIQTRMVADLTAINNEVAAVTAGSGVLVSSDDSTVGYLDGKLLAGEGIDLTVGSPAANETLTISCEDASETNKGIVELATVAECQTGTDAERAVTPAGVKASSARWGGPTGTIIIWPITPPPTNYLVSDGSAISRTTYADLFAVIGVAYGPGDGSTTFNLPDYRGEFIRGRANGSANDPDRATRTDRGDTTTGDNVGTKQTDGFKAHPHTQDYHNTGGAAGWGIYGINSDTLQGAQTSSSTGGNETRPINIYVQFCIKYQ